MLLGMGPIVMTKERADERNRTLAMRDEVTGLLNRRSLLESLSQHLSAAKRHGQALSVLMLGIDYFKCVNATHDHLTGEPIAITVSIGLCSLSQLPDSHSDDLIGATDRALYAAKAAGRNRVEVFSKEPSHEPI